MPAAPVGCCGGRLVGEVGQQENPLGPQVAGSIFPFTHPFFWVAFFGPTAIWTKKKVFCWGHLLLF